MGGQVSCCASKTEGCPSCVLVSYLMTTKERVFQEGFAKVLKRLPIPRVRWVRNHPWLQRWTTNGAGTYSKCIAFGILSVSICSVDQWRDCGNVGRCPLWWKFWWCFRATKGGSGDRSKDSLIILNLPCEVLSLKQCSMYLMFARVLHLLLLLSIVHTERVSTSHWGNLDSHQESPYSRRFATATTRTASLGSHDVGHWDQKHPKVLIVEKKTQRIW